MVDWMSGLATYLMTPDAHKGGQLTRTLYTTLPVPPRPMITNDAFHPLQLKGEIMDLDFTVDTDHRKRRRNRTTQSCLNCHTSKRKCDRKRPCQRCIQLGLTGLCVYEIDDPALRDDPSVDENTRLRNRIAELESLVRELRGKPHPRWAESNFRDGDPNEKWHSRATKCAPLSSKRNADNDPLSRAGRAHNGLLSPIKTEPSSEHNAHLYRFSPSPAPSMRYHTFQADVVANGRNGTTAPPSSATASSSSFNDSDHQRQYTNGAPGGGGGGGGGAGAGGAGGGGSAGSVGSGSPLTYNGSPVTTPHYPSNSNGHGHSYSNGEYPLSAGSDDGSNVFSDHYASSGSSGGGGGGGGGTIFCPCRTSPGTGVAYISLSQQLQSSLNSLRQYTHHPPNTQCLLYRRIVELNNLMHGIDLGDPNGGGPYDSSTPSDNELLTPLSASSGHGSFPTGSPAAVSPQEWNNLAAAGYNPYFPIPPGEHHGVYANHVMT